MRWQRPTVATCRSACCGDEPSLVNGLLLGVDGGATKTIALIGDASGTVLGAGRSGSSDIHNEVTPGIAVDHVVASVRAAANQASVSLRELRSSVFGLCGADWSEDETFYGEALRERLELATAPTITNDAFNSLRAGTADGIGVALVLGTGGAIAARGPEGRAWFSGERMQRSGALEFGQLVYDLIIRAEYGHGPRPGFEGAALRAFGATSVDALIYAVMRTGGLGKRSLARLAAVLLEASHEGDPMARRIIEDHAQALAGSVQHAAERVGLGGAGTDVVLAGGVFKHRSTGLRDAIAAAVPGFHVAPAPLEPAYGALLMAADQIGCQPDADRMVATGPEPGFFATGAAE